jgi:hypothetical protein
LPPTGVPPRWNAGARHAAWDMDDSSHGVRSPSAYRAQAIVVSVCLSDTVRSQGFSPSQRFEPAWTAWLCFAPHPPMGFGNGLQSFPHSASRDASRRPLLSCRFGWLGPLSSEPDMGLCPCLLLNRRDLLSPFASSGAHRTTRAVGVGISSGLAPTEVGSSSSERP